MRIHTVIALYVFVFSLFFELSKLQYAVLFLTFALVMSMEMVNTAVERLGDSVTEEMNEKIRVAKDMSAGAVLVSAIFSVVIGVLFFMDIEVWTLIWFYFIGHPWLFALLVAFSFLAFLYVQFGWKRTVEGIFRNLRKRK